LTFGAFESVVTVTVSTLPYPLGGLLSNFFTGKFLGTVAN
jgi:hypothetical protein